MNIEEVQPLVVRSPEGEILDVSLMNDKSYTKSRERGELWHLNRETGRILPHTAEGSMQSLKSQHTWYEAVIEGPSASAPSRPAAMRKTAPTSSENTGSGAVPQVPPVEGRSERPEADTEVLLRLERMIARRKEELPEGSYTTHLFTSGEEKIRKKTGEEAVELILAHSEEEVSYEASDLIYHLLVLLAQLGIPLKQVLRELASREEGAG